MSQALAYEKQGLATIKRLSSHATYQVGMWWRAMIIPFRTPQFSFLYNEKYKLELN